MCILYSGGLAKRYRLWLGSRSPVSAPSLDSRNKNKITETGMTGAKEDFVVYTTMHCVGHVTSDSF